MPNEHEMSGPPSPPPPPPRERQDSRGDRLDTGRYTALPPDVRSPDLPPDEDDDSHAAVAYRARRAVRLGLEARAAIGRPTTRKSDGTVVPATGLWAILEPVGEMAEDWKKQKEARVQGHGWFATRGEKLLDALLPTAVLAIVGLLAVLASRHFHW